jgi:hypothetical protein
MRPPPSISYIFRGPVTPPPARRSPTRPRRGCRLPPGLPLRRVDAAHEEVAACPIRLSAPFLQPPMRPPRATPCLHFAPVRPQKAPLLAVHARARPCSVPGTRAGAPPRPAHPRRLEPSHASDPAPTQWLLLPLFQAPIATATSSRRNGERPPTLSLPSDSFLSFFPFFFNDREAEF